MCDFIEKYSANLFLLVIIVRGALALGVVSKSTLLDYILLILTIAIYF